MNNHYHWQELIFEVRPRTSDVEIIKEVVERDCYHLTANPHDTIIDIGAHIGSFSILASRLGTDVIAYEPVKETFEILKRNVAANGFPVRIYNQAVAGENKKAIINIGSFNFGASSLYKQTGRSEPVDCITLHQVFKDNHIDMCHR